MAITIYEGKLTHLERMPEAKPDFSNPKVQKHLIDVLHDLENGRGKVNRSKDGTIWVFGDEAWIRFSPEGIIELGHPAA